MLVANIAIDIVAEVHAHVGDGGVLLVFRGLVGPASGEGEEDGGGNGGEVLIVEGDQREHALVLLEECVRLRSAQLEDVVENEAGELRLLLARPEPVREHGEEAVHELEVAQAQRLHALRLVSQVGEDLQNRLADLGRGVDQQPREVVDLAVDDALAELLLLLHQRAQQVDAGLDVLVGLALEVLLDDAEELVEVKAHAREAAEDVDDVARELAVGAVLEGAEEELHEVGVEDGVQVLVVHEEVAEGECERAQALEREEVGGRVVLREEGVHGLDHEGVLREEEGRLGVHAEQQQRVDRVHRLLAQVRLQRHDQVLHLGHHRVQLRPLDEAHARALVALLVVLPQLRRQRRVQHVRLRPRVEPAVQRADRGVPLRALHDRLALPPGDEFGEVGGIVLAEEEALLVAEQVLLVMVLEGEAGGGASGGEAELVDDLLPELVVRDRLPAALLADRLVELVQVQLLPPDLRDLDLRDPLRRPVLAQVLLKFVLLFQLRQAHASILFIIITAQHIYPHTHTHTHTRTPISPQIIPIFLQKIHSIIMQYFIRILLDPALNRQ